MNRRRLVVSLLACCCLLLPALNAGAQQKVSVSESVLRRLAQKVVMPRYPAASKKRGSKGIAVVRVDVDEKGALSDLRIVEAPDPDIEAAVAEAVRQWRFEAAHGGGGEPMALRGKLSFYFTAERGQFRVENPRQFNDSSQ